MPLVTPSALWKSGAFLGESEYWYRLDVLVGPRNGSMR